MNLPNKLTTIRMALVVALIVLLVFPYSYFAIEVPYVLNGAVSLVYLIGAVIFIIAAITDFFDGYFARKLNLITNYGKFMDPIADKLLVNSLLIILIAPQFAYHQAVPLILVVLMIGRDIIVDGFRLVAANQNKVLAANIFGKIKTVLQMIAIVLYLLNDFPFSNQMTGSAPPFVSLIIMILATVASVTSGIIYIAKNRHVLSEETSADE
ncbi:MAG TPA: CDP-diacylglycerol--glycerol-3-phosphate 3-phosphatidyltransferase [Bacilli bacterium]|nr:CDP-diacylglycerol--glycerol-3-phosphate 3-phosphatidyltransferase [Bacilli bacterium]